MKTFREFYQKRNSCTIAESENEGYDTFMVRLMETVADYMDYVANQSVVGKLEEIRCGLIDIESILEKKIELVVHDNFCNSCGERFNTPIEGKIKCPSCDCEHYTELDG